MWIGAESEFSRPARQVLGSVGFQLLYKTYDLIGNAIFEVDVKSTPFVLIKTVQFDPEGRRMSGDLLKPLNHTVHLIIVDNAIEKRQVRTQISACSHP